MGKNKIVSKWVIDGLPEFVIGSDREIYRLPFKSGRNHYEVRYIKKQKGNRWKLNSTWWSEKQLRPKLILNPSPEVLIMPEPDYPF